MAQVFVSYSRADAARAQPILEALAGAGFSIAEAGISPGVSLADTIADEIARADCIVIVWSEAAAQSQWVQREVHLAIEAWSAGKLVLVSLDDAPLPVGLRDLEAIPFRNAAETDEIIRRVGEMVHGEQQPRMAAQAPRQKAFLESRSQGRGRSGLVGSALALLLVAGLGAYFFSIGSAPPPSEQVGGSAEQPGEGAPSPSPPGVVLPGAPTEPPPKDLWPEPSGDAGATPCLSDSSRALRASSSAQVSPSPCGDGRGGAGPATGTKRLSLRRACKPQRPYPTRCRFSSPIAARTCVTLTARAADRVGGLRRVDRPPGAWIAALRGAHRARDQVLAARRADVLAERLQVRSRHPRNLRRRRLQEAVPRVPARPRRVPGRGALFSSPASRGSASPRSTRKACAPRSRACS